MCSDRVSCCVALERLDFAAALVSFTSAVFAEVIGFPSACPSRIGRCVALSILFPAAVRQGSSEHRELTGFAIGDIPLNEMRVCVCVCVREICSCFECEKKYAGPACGREPWGYPSCVQPRRAMIRPVYAPDIVANDCMCANSITKDRIILCVRWRVCDLMSMVPRCK